MPQSIQITETSPLLHDANCIYCHVDLDLGDHVVVCDSCRLPHHADCWQANANRCATFGCEGSGAIVSESEWEAEQAFKEQFRLEMEQSYYPSEPTSAQTFQDLIIVLTAMTFAGISGLLVIGFHKTLGSEPNNWLVTILMFIQFFVALGFSPHDPVDFKKEYPFLLNTFISVLIAALITMIIDGFILKYEPNSFIPLLLFLPLSLLAYWGIRFVKGSIANRD